MQVPRICSNGGQDKKTTTTTTTTLGKPVSYKVRIFEKANQFCKYNRIDGAAKEGDREKEIIEISYSYYSYGRSPVNISTPSNSMRAFVCVCVRERLEIFCTGSKQQTHTHTFRLTVLDEHRTQCK